MKTWPGDIIILHRCNVNDNYMMYGFWDTERDGQNFLSFWTIFFALLPPPSSPKTQNFEKILKMPGDIITL